MAYGNNGGGRSGGNNGSATTPMRARNARGTRADNTPYSRPMSNRGVGQSTPANMNRPPAMMRPNMGQNRSQMNTPMGGRPASRPFVTHEMHNQMHTPGHTTGGNWVIKGTNQRWTGPVVNAGSRMMTGNAVTAHSREVVSANQQPAGKTRGTATRR